MQYITVADTENVDAKGHILEKNGAHQVIIDI